MMKEEIKKTTTKKKETKTSSNVRTAKPKATAPKAEVMNTPQSKFTAEELKEFKSLQKKVHDEMGKVEKSFLNVAFNLYTIYDKKFYEELGYKNISDYSLAEFGLSKTTTNNFQNVVERFAKRVDGKIIPEIADEYKGYKSSQLTVLLSLTDDEIKRFSPDDSVRDMKKKKKEIESQYKEESENSSKADEGKQEVIDVPYKEVTYNTVAEFNDFFIQKLIENDEEANNEINGIWLTIQKLLSMGRVVKIVDCGKDKDEREKSHE